MCYIKTDILITGSLFEELDLIMYSYVREKKDVSCGMSLSL